MYAEDSGVCEGYPLPQRVLGKASQVLSGGVGKQLGWSGGHLPSMLLHALTRCSHALLSGLANTHKQTKLKALGTA